MYVGELNLDAKEPFISFSEESVITINRLELSELTLREAVSTFKFLGDTARYLYRVGDFKGMIHMMVEIGFSIINSKDIRVELLESLSSYFPNIKGAKIQLTIIDKDFKELGTKHTIAKMHSGNIVTFGIKTDRKRHDSTEVICLDTEHNSDMDFMNDFVAECLLIIEGILFDY